jgi:hypothetical protein
MSDSPDTPQEPGDARPPRRQEYEDPHYHDDDDVPSEDGGHKPRLPVGRKPARGIPPPRRPRDED